MRTARRSTRFATSCASANAAVHDVAERVERKYEVQSTKDEGMEKGRKEIEAGTDERSDPLREKSMSFAVRIVKLNHWLRDERKEFAIADQILRSGTSIGANLAEAVYAPSSRDFLNKNKISLKECSETLFWIDLLNRSEILSREQAESLRADCLELRKMLSAACKTIEDRIQDK